MRIPTKEACYRFIREMAMPDHIICHSLQVCRVALMLVHELNGQQKRLNQQLERLRNHWQEVRLNPPDRSQDGPFRVGDLFRVAAEVHLGVLQPDEVEVELYFGALKSVDTLTRSLTQKMEVMESMGDGHYRYGCDVQCQHAGRYGLTARVIPKGDDRIKFAPGLITWA